MELPARPIHHRPGPPKTRAARIDALRQVSDFAKLLGIPQVQTHCGFIPEDPADPLYPGAVEAIRTVAQHCQSNGQYFLMETGQETPTTMSRMIRDVAMPNLAVGLDTANLILYGKANPVDAVDIIGTHVRSVHAKDGRWPTDPSKLGEEVLIGKGLVDFKQVFTKLHRLGYTGAVTIERETSGPQQIEDVRNERSISKKSSAKSSPDRQHDPRCRFLSTGTLAFSGSRGYDNQEGRKWRTSRHK
jgi:L-ribulose-5-phosphate 3-epimerase